MESEITTYRAQSTCPPKESLEESMMAPLSCIVDMRESEYATDQAQSTSPPKASKKRHNGQDDTVIMHR